MRAWDPPTTQVWVGTARQLSELRYWAIFSAQFIQQGPNKIIFTVCQYLISETSNDRKHNEKRVTGESSKSRREMRGRSLSITNLKQIAKILSRASALCSCSKQGKESDFRAYWYTRALSTHAGWERRCERGIGTPPLALLFSRVCRSLKLND